MLYLNEFENYSRYDIEVRNYNTTTDFSQVIFNVLSFLECTTEEIQNIICSCLSKETQIQNNTSLRLTIR